MRTQFPLVNLRNDFGTLTQSGALFAYLTNNPSYKDWFVENSSTDFVANVKSDAKNFLALGNPIVEVTDTMTATPSTLVNMATWERIMAIIQPRSMSKEQGNSNTAFIVFHRHVISHNSIDVPYRQKTLYNRTLLELPLRALKEEGRVDVNFVRRVIVDECEKRAIPYHQFELNRPPLIQMLLAEPRSLWKLPNTGALLQPLLEHLNQAFLTPDNNLAINFGTRLSAAVMDNILYENFQPSPVVTADALVTACAFLGNAELQSYFADKIKIQADSIQSPSQSRNDSDVIKQKAKSSQVDKQPSREQLEREKKQQAEEERKTKNREEGRKRREEQQILAQQARQAREAGLQEMRGKNGNGHTDKSKEERRLLADAARIERLKPKNVDDLLNGIYGNLQTDDAVKTAAIKIVRNCTDLNEISEQADIALQLISALQNNQTQEKLLEFVGIELQTIGGDFDLNRLWALNINPDIVETLAAGEHLSHDEDKAAFLEALTPSNIEDNGQFLGKHYTTVLALAHAVTVQGDAKKTEEWLDQAPAMNLLHKLFNPS